MVIKLRHYDYSGNKTILNMPRQVNFVNGYSNYIILFWVSTTEKLINILPVILTYRSTSSYIRQNYIKANAATSYFYKYIVAGFVLNELKKKTNRFI